ncbi:hypothetical protein [Muribaculum intestinale]|uniref:hypothetical protein n=1 Tax=Muribaculum intestinale TaxID=1796646 RepID=UPI0025AA1F3F|nr:hypothetical protein [Muribaculum intestinale]
MDIDGMLSRKINLPDIKSMAHWASGDADHMATLWSAVCSADRLTSVNALWVMTHLCESESEWLRSRQDMIIDMLLSATDVAKKRMLLQILKTQDFDAVTMRADLLDFCLSKINSECEPYSIRAFSIYVAFRMARHYPELIAELEEYLKMLSFQGMSPGLACARRNTLAEIRRIEAG